MIFVILMLLFTWLSRKPGNTVVYYPNRILKGLDPWEGGSRTRNPFAWVREAVSSSEEDVINMSGVDTAVYFVFLSTGLSFLFLCQDFNTLFLSINVCFICRSICKLLVLVFCRVGLSFTFSDLCCFLSSFCF